MAKASLDFCCGEGEEANSLRSDSLLSFSSPQQKSKAPSRQNVKGQKPNRRVVGDGAMACQRVCSALALWPSACVRRAKKKSQPLERLALSTGHAHRRCVLPLPYAAP